jgi:hypothetical protein
MITCPTLSLSASPPILHAVLKLSTSLPATNAERLRKRA